MKAYRVWQVMMILGLFVICYMTVTYYNHLSQPPSHKAWKQLLDTTYTNTSTRKNILYWYKPWNTARNFVLSEECGSCVVTDDRTSIDHPSIAAIVFHFNELSYYDLPTTKRDPGQFYVYFSLETPSMVLHASSKDLHEYEGYFNWTMTYKRDSDVYIPSSTMSMVMDIIKDKYKHTEDAGISIVMKKKQRLASWIVSNCGFTQGAQNRLDLVEKIVQAGMDIDRRGRCFPDNPPPPGERANRGNEEQIEFMESSKFYIAFENAHYCKDYITEKLFINAFLVGAVPIVWGPKKADYEAVVPPHSCIFVDDYDDLTKLVDYIKYLDKNETAYEEYLHWRTLGYKHQVESMDIDLSTEDNRVHYRNCNLCRKLTMISNKTKPFASYRKTINSLKSWVFDHEEPECLE